MTNIQCETGECCHHTENDECALEKKCGVVIICDGICMSKGESDASKEEE